VRGLPAAAQLPPGRWLALRFEDLIAKPEDSLARVAEHLALPDGAWLGRAAALVGGAPPARYPGLPREEAERLAEACQPGEAALRAAP